jgi:hypothetical protein
MGGVCIGQVVGGQMAVPVTMNGIEAHRWWLRGTITSHLFARMPTFSSALQ